MTPEEFYFKRGPNYGITFNELGDPSGKVALGVGNLIFFNSQKMHAVTSGNTNDRLSLSFFIGYRGYSQPLTLGS